MPTSLPPSRPDVVYKVLRAAEWAELERTGEFAGSADDLRDGFVHLSTAEQLEGTLSKHFAGQTGLVVLEVDTRALGAALRWEASGGGALFPHLYGVLRLRDVRGQRTGIAPNSRVQRETPC